MSGERLVGSYIIRVTVRLGDRRIRVLDVGNGTIERFRTYSDLNRFLVTREGQGPPIDPPPGRLRR